MALQLEIQERNTEPKESARKIRRAGRVPGVLYGRGIETINFTVETKHLTQVLSQGDKIVGVNCDTQGQHNAVITEVSRDNLTDDLLNLDLHKIDMAQKVQIGVAIELVGDAKGVVDEHGVMQQQMVELQIECLPADLPEKIELDVSDVCVQGSLHVSDVVLPANVSLVSDPEAIVMSILAPRHEEEVSEDVEDAEGDGQEPEVIEKGKDKGQAAE